MPTGGNHVLNGHHTRWALWKPFIPAMMASVASLTQIHSHLLHRGEGSRGRRAERGRRSQTWKHGVNRRGTETLHNRHVFQPVRTERQYLTSDHVGKTSGYDPLDWNSRNPGACFLTLKPIVGLLYTYILFECFMCRVNVFLPHTHIITCHLDTGFVWLDLMSSEVA